MEEYDSRNSSSIGSTSFEDDEELPVGAEEDGIDGVAAGKGFAGIVEAVGVVLLLPESPLPLSRFDSDLSLLLVYF